MSEEPKDRDLDDASRTIARVARDIERSAIDVLVFALVIFLLGVGVGWWLAR